VTARRLKAGLALGALASLAVAGQASAAQKTVDVGGSKGTAVFNDFFRHKVAIHKDDSVSFQIRGFHNVYFPKKGGKSRELIVPDPSGTKYSGLNDAAGAPMWFDGAVTRFIVDPIGAFPSGTTTYDGSKALGSGLPLGDAPPEPYTVKFTKKGSFTYYCTVHPGMKGQVSVLPKSAKIPTAKQDEKAAKKQLARDVKLAKELDRKKVAPLTIRGGSDKPPVNHLRFYPSNLQVKAGQTITFEVNPKNQEPHTLSIGSQEFLTQVLQNQIVPDMSTNPPTVVFDGRALLPSDPPPGGKKPMSFDGASHGGFFSTGVLGAGTSKAGSMQFKITKAGQYHYICLIHPEMSGTITVK
jgi:plastocyanin